MRRCLGVSLDTPPRDGGYAAGRGDNEPVPSRAASPATEPPLRMTRRGVLVLGGLGVAAVGGLGYALVPGVGPTPDYPVTMTPEVRIDPVPVDRAALERRTGLGTAAHLYEVDGRRVSYFVTADFGRRLDAWWLTHRTQTGQAPDQIYSFGAWNAGAGRSWHNSGEAIDIAALKAGGKDLVSARYDRWRDDTAAEVRTRLRAYWQLAAGLHLHFADVVTYLYDASHANHIHVDTGRFGPAGAPRLIERSGVQVSALQAMCQHVWGRAEVQINGELDSVTRDATTAILRDHGGRGEIGDGVEAWRAFMLATMQQA